MTMSKVKAWERLNDPEYAGGLTMEQFYDLLVAAGYKEEVAHKAALQRGWDRLSDGVMM